MNSQNKSPLALILENFRKAAQTEREKGTYFEELIIQYLKNEALYKDLYSKVQTYGDWADEQSLDKRDTGIDLVAITQDGETHAIQCKFYDEDHKITKSDIDSFFTASGKKPFTHRLIVTTSANWSEHAEEALRDQHIPISKIDIFDLESSQIDWSKYLANQTIALKPQKTLREHQQIALKKVEKGLSAADRGKLIMACGTGKTFTSLKIAETLAGQAKHVLFLVPSLALLSQTLTEWTQESHTPLHSFAVCSDSDVGKKRRKGSEDDDSVQTFMHELRFPATTKADRLATEVNRRHDKNHMSVVFSTYHSIDVISQAQKEHGLPAFDLIVCDEAHRTTGATFEDKEESNFVRVHDNSYIKANKRLYMTATPRIYGEAAKVTAKDQTITLCSMDDESLYGKELHVITFSEAVARGLLVDYKVMVLAVSEEHVAQHLGNAMKDGKVQLRLDDASKIVGCWKALSKQDTREELTDDYNPMQRAVAFCQVIDGNNPDKPSKSKTHKVSSKNISAMFSHVIEAYQDYEKAQLENEGVDPASIPALSMVCEAEHVDGSMSATGKEEKLAWLKAEEGIPDNTCRILSNVRCLSEGVDVPALDAVLFMTPRNSQVDVVQSVGRVMRNAPGKKRGYVILPVVIPQGMEAHEALNDNKVYGVVWQVLQALRSHDDRFDANINRMEFDGVNPAKMEVIAVTNTVPSKSKKSKDGKTTNEKAGRNQNTIGETPDTPLGQQHEMQFSVGEIERAIYAKIVQKVGRRSYWDEWASDIAKIAASHIARIKAILENKNNKAEIAAFNAFATELRDDLNNSITDDEIIEMLAQHLITKPVFDALFASEDFTSKNPISQAMQGVLETLEKHHIEKEAETLQKFYESVKQKAGKVETAGGKQKIVLELYDKFFRNAFPKMAERLGIVYTPVEVVDFIIHSINDVLKQEFNQTLGSKGVHIIDPFTGTGTFITRLLQSGLIGKEQLPYKYKNEIHANELVLLAYYIAAINIESTYHGIVGGNYTPFEGICLTDTFELYEKEDLVSHLLEDNSKRRAKQKKLDIRVIMGNPPYSSGQTSANDNNANIPYPKLDEEIANTYAKYSTATNKNALYDSYIRAIRWASDRIQDAGVIGFVTNAGWIEALTADGMRKCLVEEFSNIYIFHLRGLRGQKTAGERAKQEGGQIFGQGSGAAIAISLLVKNPKAKNYGNIYFHNVGNYLSREEKLKIIDDFSSIKGIAQQNGWQMITPDKYNDWLNQRDDRFYDYISMGDKKDKSSITVFENYSRGLETNRDAWCYNSSKTKLTQNIRSMIEFYNSEMQRYQITSQKHNIDDFINADTTKISWNRSLKTDVAKGTTYAFESKRIFHSLYRPYSKTHSYYAQGINAYLNQLPRIFPTAEAENLVICLTVTGTKEFSVLLSDLLPDLHLIGDAQCFPLYLYDNIESKEEDKGSLFAEEEKSTEPKRRDAITDEGLAHFAKAYPTETISKEDIFYYIYGLLHSEDYRTRYTDNLTKELPRIPAVKKAEDFWHFSKAGRALADLHLNYETVEPYPVNYKEGKIHVDTLSVKDFYVEKMRFGKDGKETDKTTVIYNPKITMTGIPLEAYDYIANGKPALEWVMERQSVTTHKESDIVNDANDWAIETMNNPRYPLELFQRVITVSLETMKIVNALPKLDI